MATATPKRPSGKAKRAEAATAKRTEGASAKRAEGASAKRARVAFAAHVNPTHLRPLADRVVVEPAPREEMTKSGIVIPDTVKERPQEGTVLAVGPGRMLDDGKREPMDVKKGDRVLYAKYAAVEIKVDGNDLLIVGGRDILAVVLA